MTHGRDTGSGRYEDAVAQRLAQDEQPMWPMELDLGPILQITQEVRKEAAFDAVQAEVEKGVARGPEATE